MTNTQKSQIGSKVLLLAHGHTGNNVFCTPTIRFLKKNYPNTVFDIAALNKASAEVFEANRDINHIHVLDKKSAIKRISGEYSTIICLNPKSSYLLDECTGNKIYIPQLPDNIHHADHMLKHIGLLTQSVLNDSDRKYVIQANVAGVETMLRAQGINKNDILIGMHLGCARTAIHGWKFFFKNRATHKKIWPLEKYIALGKILVEANPKIKIFITGTKHESFLGKEFEKNVPRTINLIGKTSVSNIVGILNKSDLFITQDCGILHVASAAQVPLIALFGPTNPITVGPYPMNHDRYVIKKDSMADIYPEYIAEMVMQILNRFH